MRFTKDELKQSMRLYAVTDRAWLTPGQTLAQAAEEVLSGGATFLQLREKTLADDLFLQEAVELAALCRARKIPFVVNDRVDLALLADADGVHVGQSDLDAVGDVRAAIGPDRILGISARTVEQAIAAERAGADYLGVGAVFQTGTKQGAEVITKERFRAIRAAVSIPIVAIGGIGEDNLPFLRGYGADGVAVVSALFGAADPRTAAERLFEKTAYLGEQA